MNPRIKIDLKKLHHNAHFLNELCKQNGIYMTAVTKVFCAQPRMVETLIRAGINFFADSRIENICAYPSKDLKTMMLRLPSPALAAEIVSDCKISLNSEIDTIKALGYEAKKQNKIHDIVIMVDLGDLREGIYHTEVGKILEICRYTLAQENLNLLGIGTNLTCYGSVLPSKKNMEKLAEIAEIIEKEMDIELKVVSGGNSSALKMLAEGNLPKKINNLRLGESIVCGTETADGTHFDGLMQDVVILEATIIEIAKKPSMPEGVTNINAFGERVEYKDVGKHLRAILAFGRQDVVVDGLVPLDKGVKIIGASSDHLIVDVTNAKYLKVGDVLGFSMSYGAILAAFTSKYISHAFVD